MLWTKKFPIFRTSTVKKSNRFAFFPSGRFFHMIWFFLPSNGFDWFSKGLEGKKCCGELRKNILWISNIWILNWSKAHLLIWIENFPSLFFGVWFRRDYSYWKIFLPSKIESRKSIVLVFRNHALLRFSGIFHIFLFHRSYKYYLQWNVSFESDFPSEKQTFSASGAYYTI